MSKRALSYLLLVPVAIFAAMCALAMGYKNRGPDSRILLSAISFLAVTIYWSVKLAPPETQKTRGVEAGLLARMLFCCAAIFLPVFESAKSASTTTTCISNSKQLGLGLLMYATDFDDRLPPAQSWRTLSLPYLRSNDFQCPKASTPWSYGFNRATSGTRTNVVGESTVLIFDANAMTRDANGGMDMFVARHHNIGVVVTGDGRGITIARNGGQWLPKPPGE